MPSSAAAYRFEGPFGQLGEFKESRAAEALRRFASFDPNSAEAGPFGRTRQSLVRLAREALDKIGHDSP